MSGFSADWLALREPADHAARSTTLLAALNRGLGGMDHVTVVDLGCGTGSNLRATAPRLCPRQTWRLVDHDPALLAAARKALSGWADRSRQEGERLELAKDGRHIAVEFVQADLAAGIAGLCDGADLVTAAALFDLVSPAWIEAAAGVLASGEWPLYTTLVYDGTEHWTPPDPADAAMLEAFVAHQHGDKGFGPAAGPDAAALLAARLAHFGYEVETAPSPWRLTGHDRGLIAELAEGVAQAVRETGRVPAADIDRWLRSRRDALGCEVGHVDILAWPPAG
jgi:SAM-dependent methyltransferase